MMPEAPVSIETLKLRLISSSNNLNNTTDPLLTKDGVHYLLKALAYADSEFSTEIENVLVKAGALAVPELIKSLHAESLNIRSVATMTLIRIGQIAEQPVLDAYPKHHRKNRWIFDFILQEWGLKPPVSAEFLSVVSMGKAS
jgi:hypothetical protein